MAERARRAAKAPERLGVFAPEQEVEDALDMEIAEQLEAVDVPAAKAARRGNSSGSGRHIATPGINADAISTLLAGAPRLVDLLIQEDSIRSITHVCRDVVNLSLAAGGRVDLAPVWHTLADSLKIKAAAAAATADRPAEDQPAPAAASGSTQKVDAANPAPPAPASVPRARRRRRGAAPPPQPPPPPNPLDDVKAAVAADPARTNQIKKSEAQYNFKLSNKHLQGVETIRGRWGAAFCRELDVRSAAHRKWGDEAALVQAKRRAQQRAEEAERLRQERYEQARQAREEARQLRREEAELRFAENRMPYVPPVPYTSLHLYLEYGNGSLDAIMAPMIARHKEKVAREERERRLNESLEEEGLTTFKRDWRYRCFIASGELDGLDAVLAVARRQREARREQLGRLLDLEDMLDAAGLSCLYQPTSPLFRSWVETGQGDVAAQVDALVAQLRRELELQEQLSRRELLYMQREPLCGKFVEGRRGEHYTAEKVVAVLEDQLAGQYERTAEVFDRMLAERLPADQVSNHWARAYIRHGTGSLDAVIQHTKQQLYWHAGAQLPAVEASRPVGLWGWEDGNTAAAAAAADAARGSPSSVHKMPTCTGSPF